MTPPRDADPKLSLDPPGAGRLDTQQRDRVAAALLDHRYPTLIGPYRILELMGDGGMGVVYLAEQDKPQRKVALKVIRPGFLTPATLRRFDYETEVLGRLDHPGIAKVFGAGTADVGMGPQPYFVMELVHGKRLDEFVRDEQLSTNQRLKLLIDICNAVHHAHTKGVIHRDLKPSNILVTEDRQPKILDFGVARAIDSDVRSTTMATESGQLVGTLPYMAPEQAAGRVKELDTSSDVYALGVIAYELLSGSMPYALEGKALHEAVRVICEAEPSRLSSVDRNLRGDVETIVQKAMEKDKSRRYHTAGELAADVKRYLDYEPITARPPGTWYQLSKFAKRNKLLVGGVALLVIVLTAGVVTSTGFAIRARRQEREAKSQADIATAVSEFLTERVLAGATPEHLPDKSICDAIVNAMLDPAAAAVAEDFKDKPLTEAAVRNSLALSYNVIGRSDLGLPHAEAALVLRRRVLGEDHPDTLNSINTIAVLFHAQGDWSESEPLMRKVLERRRRVLGDDHRDTLNSINNMSALLMLQGKLSEAEPLFREALERRRRALGDDHPDTMGSIHSMGLLLEAQGKLAEAEPLVREAMERRRRVLGDVHPDTLMSITSMGGLLKTQGKLAEAEPLVREAMEGCRHVLGDDHAYTLISISSLGHLLQVQGKLERAEPLYREALERFRRVLGDDHPDTVVSINNLGTLLRSQGKLSEAEPLLREAVTKAMSNPNLGLEHPNTKRFAANYAKCLDALRRHDEAAAVRKEFGLPTPATTQAGDRAPPATTPVN